MTEHESLERDVEIQAGLAQLKMTAFRNYVDETWDLGAGFNVLAGANAQGKTNALEAVYLLSTTRLLRGQRDAEAVMDGAQRAEVQAELSGGRTQLKIVLEKGIRKRAFLNGMSLPRASDLIGRLPCVCVTSADLPIVRGEPADRRMFMDIELSQLYPAYLRDLTVYKRALEQRNSLLKAAQERFVAHDLFAVWEEQLARHGAALRGHRKRFLELLQEQASVIHAAMGGGERLDLDYLPKDEALDLEALLELLQRRRGSDVERGATTVGPHRDDVLIRIGGREARLFGSQGQQRTSVMALKLATLELGRQELGIPPLLLLDDILSDLDENRRKALVQWVLEHAGQAILTCTDVSAAGETMLEAARIFFVESGSIKPK
jgi:DNA replication and repair protein RecF